jgi:putative transposase
LKQALSKHGKPALFNTDQGSQFTSDLFVEVLLSKGIQPSMDGKGRAIDNIFVERLWRSVKYEDIYLKAYENGWQLEKGMDNYFCFYNQERMHQSLQYQTPKKVYKDSCLIVKPLSEKADKMDN